MESAAVPPRPTSRRRARRLLFLGGALALWIARDSCAQSADRRASQSPRTVRIAQSGEADFVGADNAALQQAAAALKPGDVLLIGPGTYQMDNSFFIPSGVTVRGTPGQTILRKKAGVESALVKDGNMAEGRLTVAEPRKFAPGMGITVFDDKLKDGWAVTVTTVTGVDGNVLRLSPLIGRENDVGDRPAALRVYDVAGRHAGVRNTFPILCAMHTQDVVIEDIIVDGNKAENGRIDGCRGGAIYVFKSTNTTIRNCVARNYDGDGISFQSTDHTSVRQCESYGNTGYGMHPGTGANRPLVQACRLHDNGQIGLYLCWRVTFGTFEGNEMTGNGWYGISIGHKDTDNLLVGNKVSGNGVCGVYFRRETPELSGHRNTFRNNAVTDNGGAGRGYGFYIEPHAADLVLAGNRIGDTRPGTGRTQVYGVYQVRGAGRIRSEGNAFDGVGGKDVVEDGPGDPQVMKSIE